MASISTDITYPAIPILPAGIDHAVLSQIIFWAPTSNNVPHWRTSYAFTDPVNAKVGMSVDMFQPQKHELHARGLRTANRFGALILLSISRKLHSTHPIVCEFIDFQSKVTVKDLYNTIIDNKLHKYIFHEEGSGCMFWQLRLLDQLTANGWVAVGEKARVTKVISKAAQLPGNTPILWPPVEGTFFP